MNATMILRMAGIYNLVYGLLLAFWPVQVFHSLAMPQTPGIMIQAIGMMGRCPDSTAKLMQLFSTKV